MATFYQPLLKYGRIMSRILFAIIMLLGTAVAANAQTGQYRAWAAFMYDENGAPTCYAAAHPTDRKSVPAGRISNNDPAYVYVTHRPSEKTLDVFHYRPGFELALGSTVTLNVDGDTFTLFSADDGAWARGSDTDRAIANALRKGKRLTITAKSQRGATVTDTFSLSGSGLALDAITKMCGL